MTIGRLAVRSEGIIAPGEMREIVVRHQSLAFQLTSLDIDDALGANGALWQIKSFRVGNAEQLVRSGPVAGHLFNVYAKEGIIGRPFETAQTAMEMTLIVKRLGGDPARFIATFHGLIA